MAILYMGRQHGWMSRGESYGQDVYYVYCDRCGSFNLRTYYEDKLAVKIDALDGCIAVYSQAVGASAINQLKAKGIQPVKISPGADISGLLAALQEELRQGPGSWLARAIQQATPADPSRFDQMEADGWEE